MAPQADHLRARNFARGPAAKGAIKRCWCSVAMRSLASNAPATNDKERHDDYDSTSSQDDVWRAEGLFRLRNHCARRAGSLARLAGSGIPGRCGDLGKSMLADFAGTNGGYHPILELPGKQPLPYEPARWSRSPGAIN
jgi:hypothetical protein